MQLLDVIIERIRSKGLSERQVSLEVFGHDTGIRDLKRTGATSSKRLEALCDFLDLEFYVGPKRDQIDGDSMDMTALVEKTVREAVLDAFDQRSRLREIVEKKEKSGVARIEIIKELIAELREDHGEEIGPRELTEVILGVFDKGDSPRG